MLTRRSVLARAAGLAVALGLGRPAHAAEVRLLVAGAAKAAVEKAAPALERETGDTLRTGFDTVGALRDRVLAGERPDLVILSAAAVDALADKGFVKARLSLGNVVAGLAVKRGAPVPSIATVEDLKQVLLAAPSIAHADGARGATSGAHFAKVIDALGLREQLRDRIVVLPFGVDVIHGVADGKFALGVSQSSEIVPLEGVSFVGSLPPPYALTTTYVAAAIAGSARGEALLRALDTPAVRAQFGAAGFLAR